MEPKRQKRIAKALGEAIALRRSELGVTQDDIAFRVGIGSEAVSRIERGVVLPTLPRLVDFADALECRTDELLAFGSDMPRDQSAAIAKRLEQLSAEDREIVLEVVRLLSAKLLARKERRTRG